MGELRRRGINSILLLCDRSSQEGLQFVRKAGGVVHHSELEMILKPGAAMRVGDCGVTLREQSCGDETYLAQAQGKTVGKVRLELFEGCGGIYGLVVQPEYRGKGYGKGILMRAVEKLREKGAQSIRLQVDESNGPARHIYEKGGFEPAYVMDYFQLNI
jgi:GNAT superfamily N-acetyltransferase